MKRFLMVAMVLFAVVALAGTGSASPYFVGDTNVGSLDTFLASANLENSSDASETTWAAGVLFTMFGITDLTFNTKYESTMNWQATDTDGVYAMNLNDDPAYYLVKTGGKKSGDDTFLFANNESLNWAVVALAGLNIESVTNVERISHVTSFGNTSVPEPGMLLLFGSGLLGLGLFRKKA